MGVWLRRAAALLAVLALLAPASASAQVPDPYARELAQQLVRIDQLVAQQQYARAAGPFAGGLPARRAQRFNVTLRAGLDYRIVGVCDSRCADLDLRLHDPRGVMIAEDVLTDDVPVLSVRPNMTGQHSIEVIMYSCSANPCWFAFNVYAR